MEKSLYKINPITYIIKIIIVIFITWLLLTSCTKELSRYPLNAINSDQQYATVDGYKQSLTTIYSGLAYDEFFRNYWNMQELPTDEAVSTWNDAGVLSYHVFNWTADNQALFNVYKALLYDITLCNNFINESADANLNKRKITGADADKVKKFVAEVRYMRAFYYWALMDLYANPPFPTEKTLVNSEVPKQILRKDLFTFIETELKAIESLLPSPRTNEYGRADQAACWALMARMYLNAKVYSGAEKYSEAITYSKKVIDAGYSLEKYYSWLMLGDNHLNKNEFIFTINFDNKNTITWVGTNYMALGAAGVPASVNGMSQTWQSLRMTQSIPALFPTSDTTVDHRAAFWKTGQTLTVDDIGNPSTGYSTFKYRNLDRSGTAIPQQNTFNNISDIDFPIFRIPEMYFIYAEAILRGGTGGDINTALSYMNKIRGRAYASDPNSTAGNIAAAQLTLNFLLDERCREMYWEAQRRTDLVRYNKLTTADYLWAWKGGAKAGTAVADKYNIFPIPTADKLANPNLKQNNDY